MPFPPRGAGSGLSRLAVEAILLMLGATLALLMFTPMGSYASSALFGTTSAASPSHLEVLGVHFSEGPCTSGVCIELTVRNAGPIELRNASLRGAWVLIVDDYCGEPSRVDVGGDDVLSVDEVDRLTWRDNLCTRFDGSYSSSIYATSKESHLVKLYGPQGTFTVYAYHPG